MNPLTIGMQVVGAGMSIYGAFAGAGVAKQEAAVSSDIAGQEQSINAQKLQQMQLQAGRINLQNFRNVQQARAQGLTAATSQGAQFGSGLQGGQAQATDQGLYNSLGVNQDLQIGNTIAGYNDKISSDKMQLASLGGEAATDQAWMSAGNSVMGMAGTAGNLTKGMNFNGLFGGGSPSGYGA